MKSVGSITIAELYDGEQGPQGPPGPDGPKGPKGDQGIPGPKGDDGSSLYTWVKFADNSSGGGMSDNPAGKKYLGLAYNKTTPQESTTSGEYTWTKIEGEQGIPGPPGDDGDSLYTWVRYADNSSGGGISTSPTGKDYIGIAYNKTSPTPSSTPGDYTWSLYKGPKGDKGDKGDEGPTGPQGPEGPRGAASIGLGVKVNYSAFGTENPGEVYLHGYDDNGSPADVDGFIYFQDDKLTVKKRMVDPGVALDGFLVLEKATGDAYVAIYNYLSNQFTIRDDAYGKDGYLVDHIGWVCIGRMDNDQPEHTRSASVYERAKSLYEARDEVLAEVIFKKRNITQAEFDSILNYTETDFFKRLAISTLFVNDLIGNNAFLHKLLTEKLQLQPGGAIFSGYSPAGEPPVGTQAGFHLSADGHFKARFAELLGTLRTGLGATDQARVAIQDETGISNLQFSGSGINDVSFPSQGSVAGSFEVTISSKDNVVTTHEEHTFSLGQLGPGGGVIFYDKGNWNHGWRYLESWSSVIQNQVHWGSEGTIVGTSAGIGSGKNNTDAMIASLGSNAFAAHICRNFTGGGKTDWFLPSLDEAYQMRLQHEMIGIGEITFWTSTEWADAPANYALAMSSFSGALNAHLGFSRSKHTQFITDNIVPIRRITEDDRWTVHETTKDGFQWNVTGGAPSAEVLIEPGVAYPLTGYGIEISFGSSTGHEVGDTWSFHQGEMYGLSVRDGAGNEYFKVSAGGIQTFNRGDMPIGATYIQFPGEAPPGDIFTGTWSNISSNFAGRFFRAEGGNAGSFGSSQSHAQRRVTGRWGGSRISFFNNRLGGSIYGDDNPTGWRPDKSDDDGQWQTIGIDTSLQVPTANEVRPENRTIRIWKRIA